MTTRATARKTCIPVCLANDAGHQQLANLYNCNVNIHTSTSTIPIQPTINTHNAHTLNLALYKVESEIESETWSHYCATRPIVPREVAVREERTSDCMHANPFALVNPIAPPNLAGAQGARQQALATNIVGGGPSHGDSAVVEGHSRRAN